MARLAAQLLAAELNLNVGAESCAIAEEVVLRAHLTLAEAGFDGSGEVGAAMTSELEDSAKRLEELLVLYNAGTLCQ
jgi:hypothetical protein